MGATPSITFTLVYASPYRLRYLMVGNGGEIASILPNAAGATPDLRTDAVAATPGSARNPMREVVENQVAAGDASRGTLFSQRITLVGNPTLPRLACETKVTPRTPPTGDVTGLVRPWVVTADEGAAAGDPASAGFPVIVATPPGRGVGESAYLDIKVAHSETDGFPNPPNSNGP
jgi:hypothetical protein